MTQVRELAAAAGIRALDGFVERLLKRRLLPLYSRPEGYYENDSNLANTLFQAVECEGGLEKRNRAR